MIKILSSFSRYIDNLINEVEMKYIIKETPSIVKARSADIINVKTISDLWHNNGSRTIEFEVTGTKGNLYKTVFHFENGKDVDGDVKVYCSCPMMKWWGPSWNSKIEGFRLWQMAKDVPPDIRDPQRIQKVCKHIISATEHITKMEE